MSTYENLRLRIGAASSLHIDEESKKEVALAMQMPLQDENGRDQFYTPRFLLKVLRDDCEQFEKLQLKILPIDMVTVLFACKLLQASKSEHEYRQRRGGDLFFDNGPALPTWEDRVKPLALCEDEYIQKLDVGIQERTLSSYISSFVTGTGLANPQEQQSFFDDLFATMNMPFAAFLVGDHIVEKHRERQPGLRSYDLKNATEFFSAPSLTYTVTGTRNYCFWHGTTWLRTFLNILRIAGYLSPGQREFDIGPKMEPPKFPVFLGMHAQGSYQWQEDKKESWQKFPDGCLVRSWGFRGLSNMWLDRRNFALIKKFILDHKSIFEMLKNPWNARGVNEIAPILDILSSATQMPDLGAKILLTYCCLEHLFVPSDAGAENSKYIIGGLNALKPQFGSWFKQLYGQRCEYAHKGFVIANSRTIGLITDSIKNVMALLLAKLSVN